LESGDVNVPPVVVVLGENAHQRLEQLGLSALPLLEATRRGLAAAAACTPNHPRIMPGLSAWSETVCGLREELAPEGWVRLDEGNLPWTVNAEGSIAIAVATGDEDTGREQGSPCTKSKKGPRVAEAVEANQLELFPTGVRLPATTPPGRTTWLLLIHRDARAGELRVELSRPVNMSEDNRVDGWSERIILDSTPFDRDLDLKPLSPNSPSGPDIEVEIKRRA
jgi:hypothetical protein